MSRWGWYDDDDDKDPGYDNGYGAGFNEGYRTAKEEAQAYIKWQTDLIEHLRNENSVLQAKLQSRDIKYDF